MLLVDLFGFQGYATVHFFENGTTAFKVKSRLKRSLPSAPLMISGTDRLQIPLESSYQSAWLETPEVVQHWVETGARPNLGDSNGTP